MGALRQNINCFGFLGTSGRVRAFLPERCLYPNKKKPTLFLVKEVPASGYIGGYFYLLLGFKAFDGFGQTGDDFE